MYLCKVPLNTYTCQPQEIFRDDAHGIEYSQIPSTLEKTNHMFVVSQHFFNSPKFVSLPYAQVKSEKYAYPSKMFPKTAVRVVYKQQHLNCSTLQ